MINRREFSRAFPVAVAGVSLAAGCSSTSDSTSDGGQSNSGSHTSFPALRQIDAGALSIGFAETGPADGAPVVLLHGWPYDIYSYVDVAPLLAASGYRVIAPYLGNGCKFAFRLVIRYPLTETSALQRSGHSAANTHAVRAEGLLDHLVGR